MSTILEIKGTEPISEAISAVADAIAQRDRSIDAAYASESPTRIAWADSEMELRKNGNDVLNALGAPLRALGKLIEKIDA